MMQALFTIQLYASTPFSFTIQPYPVVNGSTTLMYPRAKISTHFGDIDIAHIRIDPVSCTDNTRITFDIFPTNKADRDYFELVQTGRVKSLVLNLPGKTLGYSGIYSSNNLRLNSTGDFWSTLEFFAYEPHLDLE